MLGLRQQVQRDPVRVVVAVGDHQNLGRSGNHVDANPAKHPALGGGDIGVARAGDLVHRRNGFGAVSQRRNRLRPADAVDLIHPRDLRCQQHQRIDHAPGRRASDHQPRHPGNLGRNGIHQHRRGVRGQSPRHIKPRCRDRGPAPAQCRPGIVGPLGVLRHLLFVIGADAGSGKFQCCAVLGQDFGTGAGDLGWTESQGFRRHLEPVKAARQVDQRRIAPRPHVGDDGGGGLIDILGLLALHRKQCPETGFKIGVGAGQEQGHVDLHSAKP